MKTILMYEIIFNKRMVRNSDLVTTVNFESTREVAEGLFDKEYVE